MIPTSITNLIETYCKKIILCYNKQKQQIEYFDGVQYHKWCNLIFFDDIERLDYIKGHIYFYSHQLKFKLLKNNLTAEKTELIKFNSKRRTIIHINGIAYFLTEKKILKYNGFKWTNAISKQTNTNEKSDYSWCILYDQQLTSFLRQENDIVDYFYYCQQWYRILENSDLISIVLPPDASTTAIVLVPKEIKIQTICSSQLR